MYILFFLLLSQRACHSPFFITFHALLSTTTCMCQSYRLTHFALYTSPIMHYSHVPNSACSCFLWHSLALHIHLNKKAIKTIVKRQLLLRWPNVCTGMGTRAGNALADYL